MFSKKLLLSVIIFSFFSLLILPVRADKPKKENPTGEEAVLKTTADTLAYCIGFNNGQYLKNLLTKNSITVNLNMINAGMTDAFIKEKPVLPDTVMQKVMMALQQELMAKQESMKKEEEKKMKESGDKNKAIGAEFLEKNKKEPGVKVTASGLQYKVIKEGTGKQPKETDKVKVHYKGTFIDGKQFDSSIDRGQPAEFPLNGVIKGWTEGLQLMKVGAKYMFYIPYELAYGDRGNMGIPPSSTLIFEVELLEITTDQPTK